MRLIALVYGPYGSKTPPRRPSLFACACQGVPRGPNRATRSVVQAKGEGGTHPRTAFPALGASRPSGGIVCDG